MYQLMICLILLATSVSSSTSQAQPARLDTAFERLRVTTDSIEAKRVEQQILEVWNHSGDATVDSLFTVGNAALERGELDAAYSTFNVVIRRSPNFAGGW